MNRFLMIAVIAFCSLTFFTPSQAVGRDCRYTIDVPIEFSISLHGNGWTNDRIRDRLFDDLDTHLESTAQNLGGDVDNFDQTEVDVFFVPGMILSDGTVISDSLIATVTGYATFCVPKWVAYFWNNPPAHPTSPAY